MSHTQFLCSDVLSKLSVEIYLNDVHVLRRLNDFVDDIIHFSRLLVSTPAVWHVHAHQRDALPVDRDESSNDPFADALCPVYFFRHFLFRVIAKTCLFSYFPAHMTM